MRALLQACDVAIAGRLRPTSIQLSAGEMVCLIGPNGSGKTSLLHALADIGGPSGEVRIDGHEPRRLGPSQRIPLLSYLPASRELRWPLQARDLIALSGASADEVEEAIDALELAPVADRRLDQLSTGERNRVLIARALAPKPKLLLLDEPTANLDPLWQIRLMQIVESVLRHAGQAALIAIHDLDAAARYSRRIAVMHGGTIVADDDPGSIMGGAVIRDVFGIEKRNGLWCPAVSPLGDLRSSP